MFANDTNRVRGAVLYLSQDGACTNLFENFSENNLKGALSNDTTDNPPLFSLVNTFKDISDDIPPGLSLSSVIQGKHYKRHEGVTRLRERIPL